MSFDIQVKQAVAPRQTPPEAKVAPGLHSQTKALIVCLTLLVVCFSKPLLDLITYAAQTDLYSHILLVPFVSGYLIWLKRTDIPTTSKPSLLWAALGCAIGGSLILSYWVLKWDGRELVLPDSLSLTILSFLCFAFAAVALFWGTMRIRALGFPLAFLLFMVPFPTAVTNAIEAFFQHTSAEIAALMFGVSGTPVLRDGLFFKLPGIVIEVAQECSGIRSTLVLFITSLVGGHLFFRLKRYRAILALAIIPIAILRNGLRIFTIGLLCVYVGPDMIHSFIHRRGGPLFFAISLVPFFALSVILYRRERRLRSMQTPLDSAAIT